MSVPGFNNVTRAEFASRLIDTFLKRFLFFRRRNVASTTFKRRRYDVMKPSAISFHSPSRSPWSCARVQWWASPPCTSGWTRKLAHTSSRGLSYSNHSKCPRRREGLRKIYLHFTNGRFNNEWALVVAQSLPITDDPLSNPSIVNIYLLLCS